MSYDVWLSIGTGGPEPVRVWDDFNFTSNVSGMWRAAGVDLAAHDGQRAGHVTAELEQALEELKANPEKYKAMDSPNGWGTYADLLPCLERLLNAYRMHPLCTVNVWH